jgi:hypothetical protein
MSSVTKVKANRRNALASTGPKSDAGKSAVAKNAVRHGLLSWKPIISGFESEADWDEHCQQTLLDLQPHGHLELVLAERVALLVWRLARVARFEGEAISTGVEDAERAWNSFHSRSTSPLPRLAEKIAKASSDLALLRQLDEVADDQLLEADAVASLIETAGKFANVKIYDDDDGKADVEFPDIPDDAWLCELEWTAARLRAALNAIAQAAQWPLDRLLPALLEKLHRDLAEKTQEQQGHMSDFDRFRRRLLLADEATMERVRRYETTLERAMLRCLHELQRLQAARQGQPVPAPVAVDVNVSGDGE